MADKGTKHILIVDDAALVRMYSREALERVGFDADEALNGLEAMAKLLVSPVDLVVDVNMSQMDGLSFVKALRRHASENTSIPVLMTITEARPQIVQVAWQAGAKAYLVKPTTQKQLAAHACMLCGSVA